MLQIARNMSDAEDGFPRDKKYLLMDRDTKFSKEFGGILENVDVKAIRLPPRSPNLNPHLERFIRSIKEECLERMVFFGEKSLHAATLSYIAHYHAEGNHQGVGNQLLIPDNEVNRTVGEIECRERLGGLLRYYYRKAA
jgi:transposase InsO family protein